MRGVVFDGERYDVVDDLELRDPGPDDVVVRVTNAGVCHSDLSVVNGTIPFPTPVVLGHEGAGVVERVGPSVRTVREGQHVVLTTLGNCGACAQCESGRPTLCRATFGRRPKPFLWRGQDAFGFANVSAFAEHTVVRANQCVPVPDDIPLPSAALIGCGVLTGIGAVLNRARVPVGATVGVIGVGGIGLNVIQGARIAGASRIVAVDTNPKKEALAKEFGATDFVDPAGTDTVAAVKEVVPDGLDFTFECVGHTALVRAAIDLLGWGGTCVLLGVPPATAEASFVVAGMYLDKAILGCRYGTSRPQHDVPLYVDLYRAGRLRLDELITRTYPLDEIRSAMHDMESGELARAVLTVAP